MSKDAMNLVCDKIKRFGYTKLNKPSNKEELGKIVGELLVPFDDPVIDTIGDIILTREPPKGAFSGESSISDALLRKSFNYIIVAGVFDIFTTFLIYHFPLNDPNESYAAHITHRENDQIQYNNFPIYGYHSTFEQAIESITGIFAKLEKIET